MAMTPMFNPSQLAQQRVDTLKNSLENAIVMVLNSLGMELVAYARTMHNYTDRTGNLTNSMGYVVLKGTRPLVNGGIQGSSEALEAAQKTFDAVAARSQYAYSLVIVAGMNYAAYVESRGYNVILPAELKAKEEFVSRMKELIAKYDAKLKSMM